MRKKLEKFPKFQFFKIGKKWKGEHFRKFGKKAPHNYNFQIFKIG